MTPESSIPIPPSNIPAEQALLGGLLVNNIAYGRVSEFLRPEHFATAVHGRIYAAIGKLIERGQEANPIILRNLFDQDGALAEIGGAQYLVRLAESAVTIVNVPYYARTIHDLYLRRELITVGQDVVADAFRHDLDDDAAEQVDRAMARLFDLSEAASIGRRRSFTAAEAAQQAIDAADLAYKSGGGIVGAGSGIAALDKIVGGFAPGDLVIIGGRSGHGKSALSGTIAAATARQNVPAQIFTGEMTAGQVASRILAGISGISAGRQRRGSFDAGDVGDLIAAQREMAAWPLHIDDGPMLLPRILQQIRHAKRRHGIALAIVDYLQLISAGNDDRRQENTRAQEVGKITAAFKATAQDLDIPIIALSQLRRSDRDDKRPRIEDLRESSTIENDANTVLLIYRNELTLLEAQPVQLPKESVIDFDKRHAIWSNALEASRGRAEIMAVKVRHDRPGIAHVRFSGARSAFYDPADEP